MSVKHGRCRVAEAQVHVTDNRRGARHVPLGILSAFRGEGMNIGRLPDRLHGLGTVLAVAGHAFDKYRADNVVVRGVLDQVVDKVTARRPVPQMAMGVADWEARFQRFFSHLAQPFARGFGHTFSHSSFSALFAAEKRRGFARKIIET